MPTPWPNPAPATTQVVVAAAADAGMSRHRTKTETAGRRRIVPTVESKTMAARKASDVFVECLEAEGVKHVFGIPGEETLDLNESLSDSSVEFVPVRHEQGGAYMADVYG